MNKEDIFALMARFDAGTAAVLKLSCKDFTLELSKAAPQTGCAPAPASAAPAAPAGERGETEESPCVTAPLAGVFYAAPAPDQPPFVRPGDRVKKGETLCLLEAMKMMSEIQAPCDCVIREVLAENGALVSFGEPLMRYSEG